MELQAVMIVFYRKSLLLNHDTGNKRVCHGLLEPTFSKFV